LSGSKGPKRPRGRGRARGPKRAKPSARGGRNFRGRKGASHPFVVRAFLLAGLIGSLAILAAGGAWVTCGYRGCPDIETLTAYQPGGAPALLDRYGAPLAELHPLEHQVVELEALPAYLPAAFLAVEDRRFYRHRGVDWWRVVGAARRNLMSPGRREGASTLTMQLARTLFPERIRRVDRTFGRKLLEIRTAGQIERRFTKPEILELYLNHIYVGAGAYGIEAGAQYYFGRPATEVTLEEAAFLAGVVRAPAFYDPRRQPERALARRNLVLELMARNGRDAVDPEEIDRARDQALQVSAEPPQSRPSGRAPYFAEMVRELLEAELGSDLYRSPPTVHTTLDPVLQAAAEEELRRQIRAVETGVHGWYEPPAAAAGAPAASNRLQGAVVFLDATTGDILALVGGSDFSTSRYNRATLARRPMGSAFKPFVFAAALSRGYVASQPLADRPFTLVQAGADAWSPRNYDASFVGPMSMRRTLVESRNVPTVRLALAVGMDQVIATARTAGLREPLSTTPAAALGTELASPLELAVAYAGLAAGGPYPLPRSIKWIEAREGAPLLEVPPELSGGIGSGVAYIISDILADAVDRGTGRAVRTAGFAGPASGKTGTTQEARDVWFAGYSGNIVGVVWLGFDRPHPILAGATGGGLAAPVWGRIMQRAQAEEARAGAAGEGPRLGIAGVRPSGRELPPGVVERWVDPKTGSVMDDRCGSARESGVRELFLQEYLPATVCPAPEMRTFARVAGFFRGLFGGGDREQETTAPPEGAGAESAEQLQLRDPVPRLLGADLVPMGLTGAGPLRFPQ